MLTTVLAVSGVLALLAVLPVALFQIYGEGAGAVPLLPALAIQAPL